MSKVAAGQGGCTFLSRPPDSTFIPEDFTGDEKLMIEVAEGFTRGEVLPLRERIEAQEEGLMPMLIKRAGELGLIAVDSPADYGGLGLSKNLAARILEFLSLDASFSVTAGVTSGIGQIGLSLFGTADQKAKYLPRVCSGEWMAAYCLSEPNSGSDAMSLTTRADYKNGRWVLNGAKMWISNAKWAELFLVVAKVEGQRVSAFLVERGFPGVHIAREEHKLGLKGSSTARVLLEDAQVPEENLLYVEGKGHHVAFNALNLGRFKLASMSLGPARDALSLAAEYALDRKQFGHPISDFGLIRKKLSDMAARFFAAESMTYRTGAMIDDAFAALGGDVLGNRRAAEEYAVECSACKVFTTEAQAFVVDEALQVYGGYGFTEEFPVARHYRDSRVSRIYEGTNEINRIFIADRFTKRLRESGLDVPVSGNSYIEDLAAKAFKSAAGRAEAKGAQGVRGGQITAGALSDLLMLAYADQSARVRAKRLGGHGEALYRAFTGWANFEAASRYQAVTGSEVTIPTPDLLGVGDVAAAVLERRAPL